ncbi:MAG: UDP-glucose 4-epimerase, partial [uncultured Thermomicrobiales bacterium]
DRERGGRGPPPRAAHRGGRAYRHQLPPRVRRPLRAAPRRARRRAADRHRRRGDISLRHRRSRRLPRGLRRDRHRRPPRRRPVAARRLLRLAARQQYQGRLQHLPRRERRRVSAGDLRQQHQRRQRLPGGRADHPDDADAPAEPLRRQQGVRRVDRQLFRRRGGTVVDLHPHRLLRRREPGCARHDAAPEHLHQPARSQRPARPGDRDAGYPIRDRPRRLGQSLPAPRSHRDQGIARLRAAGRRIPPLRDQLAGRV